MGPVEPLIPAHGVGICCDKCPSFALLNKADKERPAYCLASGKNTVAGTVCLPWVQAELHDKLEDLATLKHAIRLTLPQMERAIGMLKDAVSIEEKVNG